METDAPDFDSGNGDQPEEIGDGCQQVKFLVPSRHTAAFLRRAGECAPNGMIFESVYQDRNFSTIAVTWRDADSTAFLKDVTNDSAKSCINMFSSQAIRALLDQQIEEDTRDWKIGDWKQSKALFLDSVAHSSLFMGSGLRNKRDIERR